MFSSYQSHVYIVYQVLVVRNEDESVIIIKRSIHICPSGGDTHMCDTANVWMSEHKTPFYLDTYHLPNCGGTQFNRSAESIEQRRSLSKRGVLCYYVFITSISFEFFMGCPIPLCRLKILRCCNICNGSWWENCWHLIGCEGEIALKCSLCGRWTICAGCNMQRRVSTRDF